MIIIRKFKADGRFLFLMIAVMVCAFRCWPTESFKLSDNVGNIHEFNGV